MPPSDPEDDLLPPILSRVRNQVPNFDSFDGQAVCRYTKLLRSSLIANDAQERRDTS